MSGIEKPIRIAMWSGPRNISTALMRSWGNRVDTAVIDEPFYAFYLNSTGKKHPGADEIIAKGEVNSRKVVEQLTGPIPGGKRIYFQKQMAHHLLPEVDRQWLADVSNCFLIRNPREVILSYIKRNPEPSLEDLGFAQQEKIFNFVFEQTASMPLVVDSKDILENPERMLRLLCQGIGVEFDQAMLFWPPGLRETDGMWAKYWYDDVEKSTSFQPYKAKQGFIPDRLCEIYERCRKCYERLYGYRLR
jgi:hypothetical protein